MAEEKKLPVISDDQIERRLKDELPGWWYEGRWIRRKYNTDGLLTTPAPVNTIGFHSSRTCRIVGIARPAARSCARGRAPCRGRRPAPRSR